MTEQARPEGTMQLRAVREEDGPWVRDLLRREWGAAAVVTRGLVHQADRLPGFLVLHAGEAAGLLTYRIEGPACEIVTLNSVSSGHGIGTALIKAVVEAAKEAGCLRLWLITTNDNLAAVRFYQKRGFVIAAVHRDAIEISRKLKPSIPLRGIDGIPIRDEIEMEMDLTT